MVTAPASNDTDGATAAVARHAPVMLDEVLALLEGPDDGLYVDGTYGRGGHSAALLARLGPEAQLHVFDQDPEAVAAARQRHAGDARVSVHHCNFDRMREVLGDQQGRIHGLLLDLGVSSPQLDQAARGFSFSQDGPLDMRMNPGEGLSAAEWLASSAAEDIADVLWRYGEERNSRRIARRIVEARAETPITTTAQLAKLIAGVPGPRSRTIHPATRSFQAIRIHLNRELEALESALPQALDLLAPGGRLAVISFHSLEDRIVKRYLRDRAQGEAPVIRLIKKQFPSAAECSRNSRARSAVLRGAEKRSAAP
jgi:16S rRNA (cytosine1402-N4)-methyltransferase